MRTFSDPQAVKGNIYLFLAAFAWGTTFVVQRTAMDHLGPFTYSGFRFLLGALFLLPFALFRYRKRGAVILRSPRATGKWLPLGASLLTGILVFLGINLQQIGLISSTAGKGGFITGLYVIIVPMLASLFGYRAGTGVWAGALLAVTGLYLLSATQGFALAPGDGWILACAFVWALQVLSMGWLSPRIDSFILAFGQALVCALLSISVGLLTEHISLAAVSATAFDLVYGGIVSVGLGFTFQVAGQKHAQASHAAIIMQFEAVFAVAAGRLFLGETLGIRAILGCGLMLAGMLISQLLIPRPR
ncbi:MAG TPA: DMT family transporter [Desulfobacteraceae bacterium]|nr:DMT family transporter [Desulfobacteraceae bacterium]